MKFKVQFTADQGFMDLLDEAGDLLAHELPTRDFVAVQRKALEVLVAHLRKRKYAARAGADRSERVTFRASRMSVSRLSHPLPRSGVQSNRVRVGSGRASHPSSDLAFGVVLDLEAAIVLGSAGVQGCARAPSLKRARSQDMALSIHAISDWLEIEDVLVRYCYAVHDRDWNAYRDVFANDAVIDDTVTGGVQSGVEEHMRAPALIVAA
jgi:hypothetical protein